MKHQYSSFSRSKRRHQDRNPDNPFSEVTTHLPKSIHSILRAKSVELNQPMSKLIAMALDNELEVTHPFNYDVEMPTSTFMRDAYAEEAGKIYKFLQNINYGMALDHLVLLRRDIGVMNKSVFLLAFRELKQTGMIEEFYPDRSAFKYDTTYRYYRVKELTKKDIKDKRRKRNFIEGIEPDDDNDSSI